MTSPVSSSSLSPASPVPAPALAEPVAPPAALTGRGRWDQVSVVAFSGALGGIGLGATAAAGSWSGLEDAAALIVIGTLVVGGVTGLVADRQRRRAS